MYENDSRVSKLNNLITMQVIKYVLPRVITTEYVTFDEHGFILFIIRSKFVNVRRPT